MKRLKDLTKPLARVDRVIIVRVEAHTPVTLRHYSGERNGNHKKIVQNGTISMEQSIAFVFSSRIQISQ